MYNIKKVLVLYLTFFLCSIVSTAQGSYKILKTVDKKIGSDYSQPIILPCVSNLIDIVNMDVATFKTTMKHYKYHPDEVSSGPSYIYTNLGLDLFLYDNDGKGINTIMFDPTGTNSKFAGFMIEYNQAYPRDCIPDLYNELAPFFAKSVGDEKRYALNSANNIYGITIKPLPKNEGIVIHIYKFISQ